MKRYEERRVAVVTGGTGALGRWVVGGLAARGHRVHVPRRGAGGERETIAFLREELDAEEAERVSFAPCDVTDPEAVEAFFSEIVEVEGRLEILVNGVGGFEMAPLEETTPEAWERMFSMNATSAFLCSRAAAPSMAKGSWGRIVTVASAPALERGAARMSAYAPSKAAVLNLTYSLAAELRPRGITVNAVVPTVIDTPANREAMPGADTSTWLHPREIAHTIAFLASEEGGAIHGSAIRLAKE